MPVVVGGVGGVGAAAIWTDMDDWTEVLLAEESCTWIINPNVPAADGSPETIPEVELILSPVGNEPVATDQ